MERRSAKLPLLMGLLGAIGSRPAYGADVACPGVTIEANAGFRARFPGLLERARAELAARNDIEACARVELSTRDGRAIGIDVALPDGRTASRLTLREDVVVTLQALLLVPEPVSLPGSPEKAASSPQAVSSPIAGTTRPLDGIVRATSITANPRAPEGADPETPAPAYRSSLFRIELSVIGGARIGHGQASVGLGAVSFLDIGGWLIGFQGRVDGYQTLAGGSRETALELALPLGKRFQFQHVALDVMAGPAVALMGFSTADTVVAPMGTARPRQEVVQESTAGPVPRALVGARIGFSPRSVLRTFIGIDGDFGPARAETTAEAGVPQLPIWSLGLALGATVGSK